MHGKIREQSYPVTLTHAEWLTVYKAVKKLYAQCYGVDEKALIKGIQETMHGVLVQAIREGKESSTT